MNLTRRKLYKRIPAIPAIQATSGGYLNELVNKPVIGDEVK